MKLLIDENPSPQLAAWANQQGLEASAAVYVGLQGKPDIQVWRYAYTQSRVVVTVNVGDFILLAEGFELHPGVIAFREAGLDRKTQEEGIRGSGLRSLPKRQMVRSARRMHTIAERCHEILARKPARSIGRRSR